MKKCLLVILVLCLSVPAQAETSFMDLARKILTAQTGNGTTATSSVASALSNNDIAAGLREALNLSAGKVVSQLGKTGGFSADPKIRIPLPGALQKADKTLRTLGFGPMTDDLTARMNKAAEAATPKAKALFVDAIKKMTLTDARTILTGPNDAATAYLKKNMSPGLAKQIEPIVAKAMADTGAVQSYDRVMGKYAQLPLVSTAKTNLNSYVTAKAMDGIFYYMAQEEAAIRKNPAARTTDLLKKVFAK